ncbi:GntR family transcriptional regulator [Azospirillum rugosum]|uniref:DNA-binding GntR family transcriptional regulator n=1 Tax=Azospirillum rugosum TaxID=416170 RepID=A0ABS4SR55_9PROT|nr:GntR family transcriptional regulator [Azospirillum rugosum]MBP2295029.1 DNA-binding GntR family transcriptional regulator [Azospirillum rugosum]MDQ0528852.1 DNA-binding GntR family transcriptional regulator [Azospirillum rugosum]
MTGFDLTLLAHDNLGSTIYQKLCEALMKGAFKPGDRLRIRDLAERLGTSVTPVRDAILRLVQDQALVLRSPRDIRVPMLTRAVYLEIRDIRVNLEGLAAERAAQQATPAQVRALDQLLARNEEAIRADDTPLATELNQMFHFALADIADMPVLRDILRRLWLQMGPLIADVYGGAGRTMIDHHYPLMDAIRRHDGPAAARAIQADILLASGPILERIDAADARSLAS